MLRTECQLSPGVEHLFSSVPPEDDGEQGFRGQEDVHPWDVFLSYPLMEAVTSLSPEEYKLEAEHRRLLGQWGWDKMIFRTSLAMFILGQSPDRFGTNRGGFTSQIGSEAS